MRSLLPEQRRVNGHDLIEGAIAEAQRAASAPGTGRRKRCLLIALGVWPDTGRQEVLAWRLAGLPQ